VQLDAIVEVDRLLMVLMLPGSAKSTYVDTYTPWWFTQHPTFGDATSHTASS
jgi:hypothetical protein